MSSPASPSNKYLSIDYSSLSEDELNAMLTAEGKLQLFNNVICPFGHRAWWSAVEAQAPFRYVEVSLKDKPQSYVEKFNHYGSVPFMLDNGFPIYESSIIASYFDSKYNQGKLQQRQDPQLASLVQLASAKLEVGPFYRLLKNQDASSRSEREAEVKESLSHVEQIYRENARAFRGKGPFLLGDAFSMAEINIMPFLFRFEILLKHYRQYELLKDFPLLAAALAASKARPAFNVTSRVGQVYIDGYAKYANP